MVDVSKLKMDKIEHPATFYETPDDIVKDNDLSTEEKKRRLIAGSRTRVSNLPQAARGWLVVTKASIRVITPALVKYSAPRIKLVRSRSTNPPNRPL